MWQASVAGTGRGRPWHQPEHTGVPSPGSTELVSIPLLEHKWLREAQSPATVQVGWSGYVHSPSYLILQLFKTLGRHLLKCCIMFL